MKRELHLQFSHSYLNQEEAGGAKEQQQKRSYTNF